MVMVVKVLMLLLLIGVTTARLDHVYHKGSYDPSSETKGACCNSCMCTKSMPPQCRCMDMRLNSCHSACDMCACTYSMPPQCFCHDITDFCYPPCKDTSGDQDEQDH